VRTGRWKSTLEHLRPADGGGLSDGQLLARFLDGREEDAFAALVRRHGPMVLGVCRRVLGNVHDAEDAFQATFLVLARKAAAVLRREAVAAWLYGVAHRTALRARARADKRRARERQVRDMPHPEVGPPEAQDWRPLLDRALSRLPEKYRAPVVLCDLECKSRREAARRLGLLEGTLASRLATARRLLARRLGRCGLTLSAGALAAALAEGAVAVPAPLVRETVKAAALVAGGRAAAVATPAAALMNEVLEAMWITKLKVGAAAVLAVALLGAGGIVYRAAGQGSTPPAGKTAEARPLTELEVLRREVQILKLQMEVMQAELRALKGHGAGGHREAPAAAPAATRPVVPLLPAAPGPQPAPEPCPEVAPAAPVAPRGAAGPAATRPLPAAPAPQPAPEATPEVVPATPRAPRGIAAAPETPATAAFRRGLGPAPAPADPVQEAEDALKSLREARDDEGRRRATDALEKAIQKLRQRIKSGATGPAGGE
jgi:RNA polymerase sigma factor (sigma-70 family)